MGKGGGKSSARGGGGGSSKPKSSEPVKGSAQKPVTAGELDKMTPAERIDALRAMPAGTIVSRRTTGGDKPTRFQKDSDGRWRMEIVSSKFNNRTGRFTQVREWGSASLSWSSSNIAKFAYFSTSFSSVKYPK